MWPRTIPAVVAALALAGCVAPEPKSDVTFNSDGSATATISAGRVAECKSNGGCALVTRTELAELVEAAAASAGASCHKPLGL